MPRDPFQEPFVSPIDRDAELQEGKPRIVGKPQPTAPEVGAPPPEDGLTEEERDIRLRSPFLRRMNEKLESIIYKADKVEEEGTALQNVLLTGVNRDLEGLPRQIVDIINDLAFIEPGIGYSNGVDYPEDWPTELRACDLKCIADLASKFGDDVADDANTQLDRVADAANQAEAALNQVSTPRLTGWQMFIFLVRFILAYAVHMLIGYLCCYFRGKLKLTVKVLGKKITIINLGDTISRFFGIIERALKGILGFPCNEDNAGCVDKDGTPKKQFFSPFPCCAGSCSGENIDGSRPSERRLQECVTAAVDQLLEEYIPGKGPGKPCRLCTGQPEYRDVKSKEMAKVVMDYLTTRSVLGDMDNSNPYNQERVLPLHNINPVGSMLGTAKTSRNSAEKIRGSINDNWQYRRVENSEDCALIAEGGMGGLLNKRLADLTEEDLAAAMLANIDTDISQFLGRENRRRIDLEVTDVEPFKSISETINAIDEQLGSVLEEARKYLSNIKGFTGMLSSDQFCCIIFTIAFIGNIVRFHKLCPEDDISNLFRYAEELQASKEVEDIIRILELIKEILEALQAEFLQGIELTGVSLPLGTLVEILKHVVGNTVAALFGLAVAPLDRVLTQLENSPALKELLDRNCFGISDLLGMIHCGIKWILDLIKELASELINISASNLEVLPDMRIQNMKMAFLGNLIKLIDLLLDILKSIGDCYTPEDLAERVADGVQQTFDRQVLDVIDKLDQAGVSREQWDSIGQDDPLIPGTSVEDAIDELDFIDTPIPANTFPIVPVDLGFFRDVVEEVNSIPLSSIEFVDQTGRTLSRADLDAGQGEGEFSINLNIIEEIAGRKVSREQTIENLLNMVESLRSLKRGDL